MKDKASSTAFECRKESSGKLNYGMDKEMEKKAFLNAETKVGKVLLDNRLRQRQKRTVQLNCQDAAGCPHRNH